MKSTTRPRRSATHRLTLVAPLLLALAAPTLARADSNVIDRWYVILMGDQKAGWMHFREELRNPAVTTTTKVHIEVARAGATLAIDMNSEFTETIDGRPYEMVSTQTLGAKPITRRYRFNKDGITVTVEQNGQSTRSTLDPIPGDWLTPAAARRFTALQMKEGADEFEYTMLDPMNGPTPIKVKTTVVGPATVEAMGKAVPSIEWHTVQDVSPGVVTTEYMDTKGVPIRTELLLGPLSMTVLASEKEVATGKIEPAEIMVSTFVTPSRAIANPRRLRSASYILSVETGRLADPPVTGSQRVERIDDQHVRVRIDADHLVPADPADLKAPRFRLGPAMADWRDKRVMALVEKSIHRIFTTPKPKMAEMMRRYVHGYITEKNLDVGLASASEVCRTREGDCTEHAVLLAAMLRGAGIPSRVAGGLIYAEQFAGRSRIFGYHMWTQALLADGRGQLHWVDLDATLPDATPYDATHIALNVSSLADGEMINSMAGLAPVIGQLRIEVEPANEPARRAPE